MKPTATGKAAKPIAKKPSAVEDDDDDDDDDDDEDESDDDDDDDDDVAVPSLPPPPAKSSLKQKQTPTTNAKQESTSSTTNNNNKPAKPSTPAGDKPLDKKQLFINSIKESVSVSEMKTLYPKAKAVKMQKRKVGPNHKVIQFAFITFENETDCSDAMKAHTHIGGEKVNVSFAFLNKPKNEQQQSKPSTPTSSTDLSNPKTKKDKKSNETTSPVKVNAENEKQNKKNKPEQQFSTNSIYVGQLPEHTEESDIKKLFPKSTKIELIPAKANNKGVRPGFAFVTFGDDSAAAAAIKQGPSLTLKNTQLKVNYQTKRATPTQKE